MRFRGQTSEIGIDLADGPITPEGVTRLRADFVREHERLYGHRSDPDNPVEVVAMRLVGQAGVRGLGHGLETAVQPVAGGGNRTAYFAGETLSVPLIDRQDLDQEVEGPLLIDELDSTIVVPPNTRARRHPLGHLLIEVRSS